MSPRRLETFTDGVIAVVITIMVLSLHPPTGSSLHDLRPLVPKLSVYLLSFVFVAIYWNNHHNLMHVVDRVTGAALWANAHLLFWLSLTPAAAAWLGPHLGDSAASPSMEPSCSARRSRTGSSFAASSSPTSLTLELPELWGKIGKATSRSSRISRRSQSRQLCLGFRSASTSPSRSPGSSRTEGWSAS